jgi:hypothetical protein
MKRLGALSHTLRNAACIIINRKISDYQNARLLEPSIKSVKNEKVKRMLEHNREQAKIGDDYKN